MNASMPDPVDAVAARRRGRSRLRTATLALGAGSLVAAGVVAYTLPGAAHSGITRAAGTASRVSSGGVHTVSGGSGVAAPQARGAAPTGAHAPAGSSGGAHAASGGS